MDAVETEKYKGYTIEIKYDGCDECPRSWDNLCEFHCWHKKMLLGDFHYRSDFLLDLNAKLREAQKNRDIVLSLFCYEHSGISLSLTSFYDKGLPQGHAYFDSGQVGFVIIRRKKALKEFSNTRISPKLKKQLLRIAESEVEIYNHYLNGEVYGFIITDPGGGDIDSCGGFYKTEDALSEAKDFVKCDIEETRKEHQKKLKGQIVHKAPLQVRVPL